MQQGAGSVRDAVPGACRRERFRSLPASVPLSCLMIMVIAGGCGACSVVWVHGVSVDAEDGRFRLANQAIPSLPDDVSWHCAMAC